jgi:hypothetical protein
MQRTEKVKLLDSIFNQGNTNSLKSLSRPIYPSVLIFEPRGGGLLFSGRLNPTLPKIYQDVILDDTQLDTMLVAGGNVTTFLLPNNFRD